MQTRTIIYCIISYSLQNLTNVSYTNNSICGTINSTTGGYLFLSIPYSDGWSAKVDGKQVDLLCADTAFMAIKVEAGEHDIKLEYKTPYLKEGLLISAFGLVCFVGLVVVFEIVKYKKEKLAKVIDDKISE